MPLPDPAALRVRVKRCCVTLFLSHRIAIKRPSAEDEMKRSRRMLLCCMLRCRMRPPAHAALPGGPCDERQDYGDAWRACCARCLIAPSTWYSLETR